MRFSKSYRLIALYRQLHLRQRTLRGDLISIDTVTGEFTKTTAPTFSLNDTFFPRPENMEVNFVPFSWYSFFAATCSSIGGVLSTQSLLIAASNISPSIGTGIGLAATINWILKDGLGQVGGVIFASKFGQRFDLDPRFFRYYSMLSLQIGSFLEIITALLPSALFLPMASIANVAKNISWMGMSATRTKIMDSFQRNNSIAELTAKHWSQVVAASVFGMVGGIGVSSIGSLLSIPPTIFNIVTFPLFASLSMYFTFKSCDCVNVQKLDVNRLKLLIAELLGKRLHLFTSRSAVQCVTAIPSPLDLLKTESFLLPFADPFPNVLINPPLSEGVIKSMQTGLSAKNLELFKELNIYFACHEGNYCFWTTQDFTFRNSAIPIIIIACYCSAVFRGLSEGKVMDDEERSRQMHILFDKSYDTYYATAATIASGILKEQHWRTGPDFIPSHNSVEVLDEEDEAN